MKKRVRFVWLLCLATCGGGAQTTTTPESAEPEHEAPDPEREPNELARALMRLQAPDIDEPARNNAMRHFVQLFLRAEVYVPSSGPMAIGDRSGASAWECFTDPESVALRHPGSDPRPMEARDVLARARDTRYGVVVRHEGKRWYHTGFAPADAARLLDL